MKLLIVCCVLLLCRDCTGFLCRICSYSYNPNTLDNDPKCIYNPTAITGPNSYRRCNSTCIIQENYNHVLDIIESYSRTCNPRADSGYCIPDDKQTTCFDSCLGDYCNDGIRLPLHIYYPVQDWQHPNANYYFNEATTTSNPGLPVKALVLAALVYLCVLRVAPVT